jgi:hypothetical protein
MVVVWIVWWGGVVLWMQARILMVLGAMVMINRMDMFLLRGLALAVVVVIYLVGRGWRSVAAVMGVVFCWTAVWREEVAAAGAGVEG